MADTDEQGYEQGENPDYRAWHAAMARVAGEPEEEPENVNPAFLAAVNKHLGDILRAKWAAGHRPAPEDAQMFSGQGLYDNSVTPSASSLRKPDSVPAVGKTALMQFLLRLGAGGNPEEK